MKIILHTMLHTTWERLITAVRRLLPVNPILGEFIFIKVGIDIAYSEEVHAFVDSIPEVD